MPDDVATTLAEAQNLKLVELPDGTFALATSLQGGQSGAGSTTNAIAVEQKTYTQMVNGELAGNLTATAMPNVPCKLVKFKAAYDNASRVYIGGAATISKANGTTDQTTGFQLSAGEDTGWIPVDNLNRLYYITDAVGDDLTYMAVL